MADNRDIYDRLLLYRRARKTFSLRVFLLATFFVLIAAAQWILILSIADVRDFLLKNASFSLIIFFCAYFAVMIFVFFDYTRFKFPINWILALFIVECTVWGFGRVVAESDIENFSYSFVAIALLVILIIIIGAFCPHDFTLDVVLLFVGSMVLFLGAMFFVLLHIIAKVAFAVYFYLAFVVIILIMFIMYHTQTIVGGRYAEMRIMDYLLAALIIFFDFTILFIMMFYLVSNLTKDKNSTATK